MLSARESQVAGILLIWIGLTDKEYARLLGLCERTVKNRIYTIKRKLGLPSYVSRTNFFFALQAYADTVYREQLFPQQLEFDFGPKYARPDTKHEDRARTFRVLGYPTRRGVRCAP